MFLYHCNLFLLKTRVKVMGRKSLLPLTTALEKRLFKWYTGTHEFESKRINDCYFIKMNCVNRRRPLIRNFVGISKKKKHKYFNVLTLSKLTVFIYKNNSIGNEKSTIRIVTKDLTRLAQTRSANKKLSITFQN